MMLSNAMGTSRPCTRPHARHPTVKAAQAAALQQRSRHQQQQRQHMLSVARAAATNEPAVPENVDLSDPELQRQIDALLQELDPELLMVGRVSAGQDRSIKHECNTFSVE